MIDTNVENQYINTSEENIYTNNEEVVEQGEQEVQEEKAKIEINVQHIRATKILRTMEKELNRVCLGQEMAIIQLLIAFATGQGAVITGNEGAGKTLLLQTLNSLIIGKYEEIFLNTSFNEYLLDLQHKDKEQIADVLEISYTTDTNNNVYRLLMQYLNKTKTQFIAFTGLNELIYTLPVNIADRFALHINLEALPIELEKTIVSELLKSENWRKNWKQLVPVRGVIKAKEMLALQKIVSEVSVENEAFEYACNIINNVRMSENFANYLNMNAIIALINASRAYAILSAKPQVSCSEVEFCANFVLNHRLRASVALDIEGVSISDALNEIIANTPKP